MAINSSASTVRDHNLAVTFNDRSDWGSGFVADMTLATTDASVLSGWTLSFTLADDITQIWGATIVSHVGTQYTLRNVDYNAAVSAAAPASFGFVANGAAVVAPTSYDVNAAAISAATSIAAAIPVPATPVPAVLPTLSMSDATITETGSATVGETFTASLSAPSTGTVTAHYTTADGTAKAGAGYDAASGTLSFAPGETSQTVTIATHPAISGTTRFALDLSGASLATIATAQATGTIINPALPIVTVADAQAQQGSGESFTASGIGTLLPAGFLSTSGNQIVDAAGTPVRINAINWFGMETSGGAPDGLWQVNYRSTMQQMVQLGFNAIRIPFSLQSLSPSSIPSNISASLNPDLAGLTSLQVLDRIVAEAGTLGLKIILDNHTASVGSSANPNGLWYDANFSSQTFTNDWVSLASHYAGNSTVIGFDLLNEPHGPASWGDGNPATDWQRQATITGDAIQAVNPNALILVEGVQTTAGISTAWGENLSGVASHPVVLATPDKLVYSAHDYPVSVTGNSYFNDPSYPANLPGIWTQDWGYIAQQGIAPVLIGEYGSKLATTTDQVWISSLVNYLNGSPTASTVSATPSGEQPYSWAYWDWNPNSGDTGGILKDDWTTVDQTKLAAITPAFWKPAADGPGEVDFALRLSQAATTDITLHVQTVDGTARQGVDYAPVSEDVVFKAGSTSAVVAVDLLQTSTGSAQSLFFLRLADPIGASLDTTDATGTILPAVATTTTTTPTTTPTTTTPATTTTTPDPTPSTTDAQPSVGPGVVRVDMQNDWGSGLVANVTVSNTGSTVSGAWQIELTTTEQITNLWNGTILSHIGSVYEIGNASYNGAIVAGGSTVFGFQASHVVAGEGLAAQIVRFS